MGSWLLRVGPQFRELQAMGEIDDRPFRDGI